MSSEPHRFLSRQIQTSIVLIRGCCQTNHIFFVVPAQRVMTHERVFSFTTLYVFTSKPLFYLKIFLDSRPRNFSQVISFGESLGNTRR